MRNTNEAKDRPLYRVTFSRITGQDRDGRDTLSRPKEIGAVWPRKNGKAGGVLTLDLIPVELAQDGSIAAFTATNALQVTIGAW